MYYPEALPPIIAFLRDIGLAVEIGPGAAGGFLPGVNIHAGILHVDPDTLVGSGDVLHEAGHIAIVPRRFWPQLGTDLQQSTTAAITAEMGVPDDPVLRQIQLNSEGMAQAWSYAAALAIGVPPACIFFPGAYKHTDYEGTHPMQRWIESGTHFGLPSLAQAGMTGVAGPFALLQNNGLPPFPQMTRWLLD
ncbi:hypothetical protein [Oleisolibacter albus]|uniref:hypothetical protein n=1 Tax=Oleisolibacter albus TaxID=2171757 RepID=UPI000DF29AC1|nr:hypothetical protein [Oleisolibacter albus]